MTKPIAIIAGEPNSISSEIIFKFWKYRKKFYHKPIVIIGNAKLLELQNKKLRYQIPIKKVDLNFKKENLIGNKLHVYAVKINQNNPFQKINLPSSRKSTKKRVPWNNEQLMMFLQSKNTGRNEFNATVIAIYSGMRLGEICDLQNKDIENRCFHVKEGKTRAASRAIPVHQLIEPIIDNLKNSSKKAARIKLSKK